MGGAVELLLESGSEVSLKELIKAHIVWIFIIMGWGGILIGN